MKKLLFAIIICTSTVLFSQEKKGTLQFEKETIDYGMVEQNSNGERYFVFTNNGKSPVTIHKIKGSCGCTVATKPEKPILPGESEKIKVKYATNRLGKFSKTITVFSDAKENKKTIRIKGVVLNSSEFALANK